jgi:hypothetical protein
MPDPDGPRPQGGAPPDPPHRDPNAPDTAGEAATWGGEGGAGSYRGSPLTQPPLKDAEKKEG